MATPPDPAVQALINTEMGRRIKNELAAHGTVSIGAGDLPEGVDLEMWRRVARRIAHEMGRPFHSAVGAGDAWATLTDFPATPAEREAHLARLHRVVEAVAGLQ